MATFPMQHSDWRITRRDFLKYLGTTFAYLPLSSVVRPGRLCAGGTQIRFGMVTDCHYADRVPRGTRYYRHSFQKMTECVEALNEQTALFLVELGDLKDRDKPGNEHRVLSYLHIIEDVLQQFNGATYHVLGNHDMDCISKSQFLAAVTNTGIPPRRTYYSFDAKDIHFVVLDANFLSDGTPYDHGNFNWKDTNIPAHELAWLGRDLAKTPLPAVVFIHQPLDGSGRYYVNNADAVRGVLAASGKVLAVFQGHYHQGAHTCLNGIHYYTLRAMVEGPGTENNSFAVVDIYDDCSITVTGFRKAASRKMPRTAHSPNAVSL